MPRHPISGRGYVQGVGIFFWDLYNVRLSLSILRWSMDKLHLMVEVMYVGQNQRAAQGLGYFQCAACFYESLPKIEREYRTCQGASALSRAGGSSGRDLLTQCGSSLRKPLHFLTRADMSQVRYLPNVKPTFGFSLAGVCLSMIFLKQTDRSERNLGTRGFSMRPNFP